MDSRNGSPAMWQVTRIDPQLRSLWLSDGRRLGFAEARRAGIEVEEALAR